jgi:hypothetical protein
LNLNINIRGGYVIDLSEPGGPTKLISTEQVKFPAPHVLAGDIPLQNIMREAVRNFIKKSLLSVA